MSKQPEINLVVTDLDNTLYDWVSSFVPSLYGMVAIASQILDASEEQILDELKLVHQRHHNSEHPFALLETNVVLERYPGISRKELKHTLNDAFYRFNKLRKKNLKLYPLVRETLSKIQEMNCFIVAHTDATLENILHRIKLLDLDKWIERFYTSPSSPSKEEHPDPRWLSGYDSFIELVRPLPQGHDKPDPAVLKDICDDYGIAAENTLYIGDSLTKDIVMAKLAGTHSAFAAYGKKFDPSYWDKLVRITHWTEEDVDREVYLKNKFQGVKADVELSRSFMEVLDYFKFSGKNKKYL
ncbi:MAG: HAD family hydrolase [Cyanobacteria bacterium P01_D01_bin.56]